MRQPLVLAALLTLTTLACDKKDEGKDAGKDAGKAKDRPGLKLSNDTPACQQALACCEEMVKADKGEAKPEDINLSCSGVGMAADDKTCDDFKKGFAMSFESKSKPVPDSCK